MIIAILADSAHHSSNVLLMVQLGLGFFFFIFIFVRVYKGCGRRCRQDDEEQGQIDYFIKRAFK